MLTQEFALFVINTLLPDPTIPSYLLGTLKLCLFLGLFAKTCLLLEDLAEEADIVNARKHT